MVEDIRLLNEENNQVDKLKTENDSLKYDRLMLKTEIADLEFKIKDMNSRNERLTDQLKERENTISDINEQCESSDSKSRRVEFEISQYKSYHETIKRITHCLDVENSMKQNLKRRSVFSAIFNSAKKFKMSDNCSRNCSRRMTTVRLRSHIKGTTRYLGTQHKIFEWRHEIHTGG